MNMKKDEEYILDICDELLGQKCLRQHRFNFLTGDTGRKLPVDGYYEDLALVIEYRERQHTESVPFFDHRLTASGVTRDQQRQIYDQRRRDLLPKYGIQLVELNYTEFPHNLRKRLLRILDKDVLQLRMRLETILARSL